MNVLTALTSTNGSSTTTGMIITGILLFGFFFIITVFLAVLMGNFCSDFFNNTLPKWWTVVKNFFSLNTVFGYEYDYPPKRKAQPYQPVTTPCKVHEWGKVKSEKHNWQMICGIPSGDSHLIDTIAEHCKSEPFHSETSLQIIDNWKSRGAVRVFTSWNHYRCKICWATQIHEFYTMPIKADGRPLIEVKLTAGTTYASKFKQTTRIATVAASTNTTTTNTRREVPVESLPYYCS